MVDSIPNGELAVELRYMREEIAKVAQNMITRESFDEWRTGHNQRIDRLESDSKQNRDDFSKYKDTVDSMQRAKWNGILLAGVAALLSLVLKFFVPSP
jgi:hypothetical protein